MKLKYEFSIREIAGENILVPLGEGALAIAGLITTNEVGAFICEQLKEEITKEQLLKAVLEEFEIGEEEAKEDLEQFLDQARKYGMLED